MSRSLAGFAALGCVVGSVRWILSFPADNGSILGIVEWILCTGTFLVFLSATSAYALQGPKQGAPSLEPSLTASGERRGPRDSV
jgi:hypothetical protein